MKISKRLKWIVVGVPLTFIGGLLLAQVSNYCESNPTHCSSVNESSSTHPLQGYRLDIQESDQLSYLDTERIKIINHTGKIANNIIVCPFQMDDPSECSISTSGHITISGDAVDIQSFASVIDAGFGGDILFDEFANDTISNTIKSWKQLTDGENEGLWINLKRSSTGTSFVDLQVYETIPRKVFAPFRTEKELYKLVKRTQTPNHDLSFDAGELEDQSCSGTPTAISGTCFGNDIDCIGRFNKINCDIPTDNNGNKVCQWVPSCIGDPSCTSDTDAYLSESQCTSRTYQKVIPASGNRQFGLITTENCEWAPSDLACSRISNSLHCGSRAGCSWNESDNSGLEICIANQSINESTTISESQTSIVGYQCGGSYEEPISFCSGTYTTQSSSCTGDDYETSAGFCGGTISGISPIQPEYIEPSGMACGELARDANTCSQVLHLGCNWNGNECTGVFQEEFMAQIQEQNETVFNNEPYFGAIEMYWKNPMQYWLPGTACALIATPENYGNLRSVGCSTDGTNYSGKLNAPFLRTDVPYNGGRCSNFGTDSNSCEQISGCTWNNPIIESCAGKTQTQCNTSQNSVGENVCDWRTTSHNNQCSNQTAEIPCLTQNSECQWQTVNQTINCPSFNSTEHDQSDCLTNTGEFTNGNEACSWNPIFADEVDIPGCGIPAPQYKWVTDGWGNCGYSESEAVSNSNIGFYAPPTNCALGDEELQQNSNAGSVSSINMLEFLKYFKPQTVQAALIGAGGGSDGSYPETRPAIPIYCSPSQPLGGNPGSTAQKRTQNFKCVPVNNACSIGVDESLCVNSVGPKPIHEESCTVVGNDVSQYCSQSGCSIWNPNGTPDDSTNVCVVYSSYAGCFGKPNVESIPACSGHNCYGKSAITCQNSENSQCCEFYNLYD